MTREITNPASKRGRAEKEFIPCATHLPLNFLVFYDNITELTVFFRIINIDDPVKSHTVDLLIQHTALHRWILRYILYVKSPCGCFYMSLNIEGLVK